MPKVTKRQFRGNQYRKADPVLLDTTTSTTSTTPASATTPTTTPTTTTRPPKTIPTTIAGTATPVITTTISNTNVSYVTNSTAHLSASTSTSSSVSTMDFQLPLEPQSASSSLSMTSDATLTVTGTTPVATASSAKLNDQLSTSNLLFSSANSQPDSIIVIFIVQTKLILELMGRLSSGSIACNDHLAMFLRISVKCYSGIVPAFDFTCSVCGVLIESSVMSNRDVDHRFLL